MATKVVEVGAPEVNNDGMHSGGVESGSKIIGEVGEKEGKGHVEAGRESYSETKTANGLRKGESEISGSSNDKSETKGTRIASETVGHHTFGSTSTIVPKNAVISMATVAERKKASEKIPEIEGSGEGTDDFANHGNEKNNGSEALVPATVTGSSAATGIFIDFLSSKPPTDLSSDESLKLKETSGITETVAPVAHSKTPQKLGSTVASHESITTAGRGAWDTIPERQTSIESFENITVLTSSENSMHATNAELSSTESRRPETSVSTNYGKGLARNEKVSTAGGVEARRTTRATDERSESTEPDSDWITVTGTLAPPVLKEQPTTIAHAFSENAEIETYSTDEEIHSATHIRTSSVADFQVTAIAIPDNEVQKKRGTTGQLESTATAPLFESGLKNSLANPVSELSEKEESSRTTGSTASNETSKSTPEAVARTTRVHIESETSRSTSNLQTSSTEFTYIKPESFSEVPRIHHASKEQLQKTNSELGLEIVEVGNNTKQGTKVMETTSAKVLESERSAETRFIGSHRPSQTETTENILSSALIISSSDTASVVQTSTGGGLELTEKVAGTENVRTLTPPETAISERTVKQTSLPRTAERKEVIATTVVTSRKVTESYEVNRKPEILATIPATSTSGDMHEAITHPTNVRTSVRSDHLEIEPETENKSQSATVKPVSHDKTPKPSEKPDSSTSVPSNPITPIGISLLREFTVLQMTPSPSGTNNIAKTIHFGGSTVAKNEKISATAPLTRNTGNSVVNEFEKQEFSTSKLGSTGSVGDEAVVNESKRPNSFTSAPGSTNNAEGSTLKELEKAELATTEHGRTSAGKGSIMEELGKPESATDRPQSMGSAIGMEEDTGKAQGISRGFSLETVTPVVVLQKPQEIIARHSTEESEIEGSGEEATTSILMISGTELVEIVNETEIVSDTVSGTVQKVGLEIVPTVGAQPTKESFGAVEYHPKNAFMTVPVNVATATRTDGTSGTQTFAELTSEAMENESTQPATASTENETSGTFATKKPGDTAHEEGIPTATGLPSVTDELRRKEGTVLNSTEISGTTKEDIGEKSNISAETISFTTEGKSEGLSKENEHRVSSASPTATTDKSDNKPGGLPALVPEDTVVSSRKPQEASIEANVHARTFPAKSSAEAAGRSTTFSTPEPSSTERTNSEASGSDSDHRATKSGAIENTKQSPIASIPTDNTENTEAVLEKTTSKNQGALKINETVIRKPKVNLSGTIGTQVLSTFEPNISESLTLSFEPSKSISRGALSSLTFSGTGSSATTKSLASGSLVIQGGKIIIKDKTHEVGLEIVPGTGITEAGTSAAASMVTEMEHDKTTGTSALAITEKLGATEISEGGISVPTKAPAEFLTSEDQKRSNSEATKRSETSEVPAATITAESASDQSGVSDLNTFKVTKSMGSDDSSDVTTLDVRPSVPTINSSTTDNEESFKNRTKPGGAQEGIIHVDIEKPVTVSSRKPPVTFPESEVEGTQSPTSSAFVRIPMASPNGELKNASESVSGSKFDETEDGKHSIPIETSTNASTPLEKETSVASEFVITKQVVFAIPTSAEGISEKKVETSQNSEATTNNEQKNATEATVKAEVTEAFSGTREKGAFESPESFKTTGGLLSPLTVTAAVAVESQFGTKKWESSATSVSPSEEEKTLKATINGVQGRGITELETSTKSGSGDEKERELASATATSLVEGRTSILEVSTAAAKLPSSLKARGTEEAEGHLWSKNKKEDRILQTTESVVLASEITKVNKPETENELMSSTEGKHIKGDYSTLKPTAASESSESESPETATPCSKNAGFSDTIQVTTSKEGTQKRRTEITAASKTDGTGKVSTDALVSDSSRISITTVSTESITKTETSELVKFENPETPGLLATRSETEPVTRESESMAKELGLVTRELESTTKGPESSSVESKSMPKKPGSTTKGPALTTRPEFATWGSDSITRKPELTGELEPITREPPTTSELITSGATELREKTISVPSVSDHTPVSSVSRIFRSSSTSPSREVAAKPESTVTVTNSESFPSMVAIGRGEISTEEQAIPPVKAVESTDVPISQSPGTSVEVHTTAPYREKINSVIGFTKVSANSTLTSGAAKIPSTQLGHTVKLEPASETGKTGAKTTTIVSSATSGYEFINLEHSGPTVSPGGQVSVPAIKTEELLSKISTVDSGKSTVTGNRKKLTHDTSQQSAVSSEGFFRVVQEVIFLICDFGHLVLEVVQSNQGIDQPSVFDKKFKSDLKNNFFQK